MNLTPEAKAKTADVLKALESRNDAVFFLEPVDYEGLGLLDYPKVIEHPMDFRTIREKLAAGTYNNVEEVFDDVQLIYDNCMLYNDDTSDVFKMAARMQETTRLEVTRAFGPLKFGQKSTAFRELQSQRQELDDFDEWAHQNHLRRKAALQ